MVSSTDGSSTSTGWKRRSSAASFSTCLRYSSIVVAPIMCSSPRASIGLSMLPASIAPSAAPAPTTLCSSSTNRRIRPSDRVTSLSTALSRSSNSPRYLAPATSAPMSRAKIVLSRRPSGTSPLTMRWANPSTIAVLPTPGSPIRTGLFFVLRDRIWMTRRISRVPPDDGVELAGPGLVDEIAAVLLQRLVGHLGHRRRHPLVAADLGEHLQERVAGESLSGEHPAGRRRRALGEQCQHEVLDRHVLVLQPLGLALGGVEQAAEPLGEEHLTRRRARPGHAGTPRQLAFQVRPQAVGVGPGLCHQTRHEPVGLVEEGEEEVLAVDLGVAEAQRLGLGVVQRLLRLLGEAVHVHGRVLLLCGVRFGWPPALRGLQTGRCGRGDRRRGRGRRS